jgi:hypothetical protein
MHTAPRLPSAKKEFTATPTIRISPDQTREEIIQYLSSLRHSKIENRKSKIENPQPVSLIADLAFYAGRYMDSCDWKPFFKAAFERNPVSIEQFRDMDLAAVYNQLQSWPNESIYDGNRLALPDEVVNFQRGDGIEKAITLVNVARAHHMEVSWEQHAETISIRQGKVRFGFTTVKKIEVHLG